MTTTASPAATQPSSNAKPAASHPPPTSPSSPVPLFHTLQAISDLLNSAVVTSDFAFAFTLNESVRRHLVSPMRRRLYKSCHYPYSQPALDAPYDDRSTATLIHRVLCDILRCPATTLAHALDDIQRTVNALPTSALAFKVLVAVWSDLVMPLRNSIYLWFTAAIVEDPRHQFFISEGKDPEVIEERLPAFITAPVAERIHFVGNVRKCQIVLAKERREPLHDPENITAFASLLQDPLSAELEIEAASLKWRIAAAEQLSQILPFDRIRNRVFLLRQYLLLGHSAFWRSFFDELRSKPLLLISRDLDPEERQNVEKTIMQILAYTFQDFASENAALPERSSMTESPLALHVTEKGDIVPQFTLSFAESRVLASKSSVYCDVFSITFNVRRVACELRAAYASLQALDRLLRRASSSNDRRTATACLVQIRELRRCMANFVDGFEWYLQVEVLQPKFDELLGLLDNYLERKEQVSPSSSRQPFFDIVCSTHETLLDKVFAQCFVGQNQINTRLNGIFAACFSLCDFVQELTVEALQHDHFTDTLTALETSFSRNVGLLVRLLLHMQHSSADSRIPALLARINFNRYLQS